MVLQRDGNWHTKDFSMTTMSLLDLSAPRPQASPCLKRRIVLPVGWELIWLLLYFEHKNRKKKYSNDFSLFIIINLF